MSSRRRTSEVNLPPVVPWSAREQSYKRTVKNLFKKQFLLKLRSFASIVEFFIALVIYLALFPIWKLSRTEYPGEPSPSATVVIPNLFLGIFANTTEPPNIIMLPDRPIVRNVIGTAFNTIFTALNLNIPINYVENTDSMRNIIQGSDRNGLGIHWVNADSSNASTSPDFILYRQSLGPSIDNDVISILNRAVANYSLSIADPSMEADINMHLKTAFTFQKFAKPPLVTEFDLTIALAFFVILPIILSTMPDFQTVLDEKDNKVAALSFSMGCSETAYWSVIFLTPFILSLFPYLGLSIMLCYGFGLVGTSFSLMYLASILFIISHIFFQMWLMSMMKNGSTGRAMTVVFIVFAIFFSYLHSFLTLNEANSSETLKHVFSIVPLSAYQLMIMSMYAQKLKSLPTSTWSNFFEDKPYPTWMAIMWLSIDSILYFLLFLVFNATMSRKYGTNLIKWSEVFSLSAWKRVFGGELESSSQLGPNSRTFIEVEGLTKIYDDGDKEVQALKSVNFNIKRGEVIVMIGPNGAGKSTLMNILAGVVPPTSGTVKILGGQSSTRFTELQKYLGVTFQDNVIIPLLSIREHFYLFGAFRGVPEHELEEAITFFANTLQLDGMLDNRAGDLSGGQKRKLCLAMSLLGNPPLVILDEPTAGVDVQARQLIWKTISSLKNTTSIITSHALEEAEAVSSRLFIASGGKLPFLGTSTEFRNQYKCGYLLRIERPDGQVGPVLDLAKQYVPESHVTEDRTDTIAMPVDDNIPKFLRELSTRKEEFGINSYAFSVEQLEDMLIKLIQTEDAANV